MKQLLMALFIVLSFSAQAQQSKKDSLQTQITLPADSVKIISKEDLEKYIKFIRENISVNGYDAMKPHEVIQQLYFWFVKEYSTAQQPKKK